MTRLSAVRDGAHWRHLVKLARHERQPGLALVSTAQLACGFGGMALAVHRRHAFDLPFWPGQPSAVSRDCVLIGTALSAPVVMLGAQAWAIVETA
jgi:hypothetical protein